MTTSRSLSATARRAAATAFLFAVGSCWSTPSEAQLPANLARRRIVEVEIAGESSGATGVDDIGIALGTPLTRALLRTAIRRLLESGRWADVQIDAHPIGRDVALTVTLRPRIVITRTDVMGNAVLSDDEVRSTLGISASGELDDRALTPLSDAVAAAYRERGYGSAAVEVSLRDTDDPSRKVLRVQVTEGTPITVVRYRYEGESPPANLDLPGTIGLGIGAVLDLIRLREGHREAERALRAAGYFESRLGTPSVEQDGNDATLVIPLRLGPRYTIRIVGNEPIERSTVEEVLELEATRLTRTTLVALRERVITLLQRHGYREANVEIARYRGDGRGTAFLEVQIELGAPLEIVGISFPGATHYSSDYLNGQVVSVLQENLPDTRFFSTVDSDTLDRIGLAGDSIVRAARTRPPPLYVDPARVYYEPLYEQVMEHLTEVYQSAGYLSAEVGPAELEPAGRGRAVVSIPIVEGPRTLLFDVALQGNEILSARELLLAANLHREDPFSYVALEDAITRMTELYQERGYVYARIEPDVRFSEDRERAEIVFTVIEQFEVHFGSITIEGNDLTDEGLIRDALRFRQGDVYRPSLIRRSQATLMALGAFSAVNIAPADPELAEHEKPMIVRVRERDPGYIEPQIGVSTGQGARASLDFGYDNVGGYALGLSLRFQLGFQFLFQDPELEQNISRLPIQDRLERRFTGGATLPRIPGLDNVQTTLEGVHLRDNQRAFGLDKNGAILSFTWRPLTGLTFTLSNEIEWNNVRLFNADSIAEILEREMGNPQIVRLLRVPEGESAFASERVTATLDQRDNAFVPRDGWFTSATVEWVHTVPPNDTAYSHLLRLSGTLNGYVPIGEVVIAGQVRAGGIVHLEDSSQSYPNRQFFLGGVNSLRGFNQDQLQPQDIVDELEDGDTLPATVLRGSEFFYLVRVEVRFPIVDPVNGALFTDLGNHWADPALIRLDESFIRPTAGFGIRLATPVGPLSLDLGFNLLQRAALNEPVVAFHFSIGVF